MSAPALGRGNGRWRHQRVAFKGKIGLAAPRAQTDLDEIWDYTVDRWGFDQAETYTRQLWKDIAIVADRPSLGRECHEVRRGYRV
jgi:plasmid stabilization system protein ParE